MYRQYVLYIGINIVYVIYLHKVPNAYALETIDTNVILYNETFKHLPKPSDVTPQETPKCAQGFKKQNPPQPDQGRFSREPQRFWKLQDLKGKNGRKLPRRIGEPLKMRPQKDGIFYI